MVGTARRTRRTQEVLVAVWPDITEGTLASAHSSRARDLTHSTALKIANRHLELVGTIHDERTVARNRLGDRNAGEKEEPPAPRRAPQPQRFARAEPG